MTNLVFWYQVPFQCSQYVGFPQHGQHTTETAIHGEIIQGLSLCVLRQCSTVCHLSKYIFIEHMGQLSVCVSVLPVCLSKYIFFEHGTTVCLCVCLFVCVCQSVCACLSVRVCLFTGQVIHLALCLPKLPMFCLSVQSPSCVQFCQDMHITYGSKQKTPWL